MFKFKTKPWLLSLSVAGVLSLGVMPANAGFLEDFYNSAGASSNVTSADVYRTESMNVMTGGGLVWKTPQRNFQPFSITPPSLRMGCGGIDIFLGAFGLASKEEFIKFMRNVGQNSAGLAFKVALQTMSPELEAKIQDIVTYINEMNQYFGNSCQAAKALMDAGASKWLKEKVQSAKLQLLGSGQASDYSEADQQTVTDGQKVIDNTPTVLNSGGKVENAAELNILWSALNSGYMELSDNEKGMMMGLMGSVIMTKEGSGQDQTLKANFLTPLFELKELVGEPDSNTTIPIYRCDDDQKCLHPNKVDISEKPFAKIVFEKATSLRSAILNRTPPNQNDLKLLTVTTSIPIYKIIQVSTYPNRQYFGENVIKMYSQAVAWELASRYIEDMGHHVAKMLKTSKENNDSEQKITKLEQMETRIAVLKTDMGKIRSEIYEQIIKNGAMLAQIEHMEKVLYSSISADLAANASFGR